MPFRAPKKGTLFGKPKGEVIKHPGALREAAARAGRTTHEEADVESHSSNPHIRSRGSLGKALMGMHKG